jgi:hypothetical protein
MALAQIFAPLQALLVFLLIPPAAGAVLLTRFGSMPYAARGGSGVVTSTAHSTPKSSPQRSAPLPGDVIDVDGTSADASTEDESSSPSLDDSNGREEIANGGVEEVDIPDL